MDSRDDFLAGLLRGAVPEVKDEFDQTNRATIGTLTGERRLLMAILEDAIECLSGKKPAGGYSAARKENPQRQARNWFRGKDSRYVFSFVCICDHLGLDAGAVRAEVLGKKRAA